MKVEPEDVGVIVLDSAARNKMLDEAAEALGLHKDMKKKGVEASQNVIEEIPNDILTTEEIDKFHKEFLSRFCQVSPEMIRKAMDESLTDRQLKVIHEVAIEHSWLLAKFMDLTDDIHDRLSSSLDQTVVALLGDKIGVDRS